MVNYGMKMVIHLKGSGIILKRRGGEYIILEKVPILGENGKKINKMDLVLKNGQEEVYFLVVILMEIKMVLVY